MTAFHDPAIVAALAILGFWLESINGKHGWLDELLAPWPLALGGGLYFCFERALA